MPRCVGAGCGAPAARTRRRRRAPWCSCAVVVRRGTSGRRAGGGGLGGDKAASGRGSGPSSGPLHRSARCCAHSCSTLTRPHRRSFSPTTASGPRGVRGAPRLSLWGPQGARRSRRTRPSRRSAPGPGARSTRGATSSSRTRRATSAGASCPGSLRAPRVARVDASDAARVAYILEDYAEDEAAGAGGACARLDAALALVAKRLGPDDTARAKRFLDAGDLAACARLLLDKLYDRHLGRRGRRGARRPATDPFDAAAVAVAVVAAVSRADAAELSPPPLVEVTRPPPRDRDDDCVQWCAPSEPRRRRRCRCAAAASCFGPLC